MEALIAGTLLLVMGVAKLTIWLTRGEWKDVSEVLKRELDDEEK